MPVIKIGKVPFNVYLTTKVVSVLDSACESLDVEDGDAAFKASIYLGASLNTGVRNLLRSVIDALPKLKKLGVTQVGVSVGLVGYYPAIALLGTDVDPTAPSALIRAIKANNNSKVKIENHLEVKDYGDEGFVVASNLSKGRYPSQPLGMITMSFLGSDNSVSPDLAKILGRGYMSFMDDIGAEGLFGEIKALAKGNTALAKFLSVHIDEDGDQDIYGSTTKVVYTLRDAFRGDVIEQAPYTEEQCKKDLGSILDRNGIGGSDLTFDKLLVEEDYIKIFFDKDDPYQYGLAALGL